MTKIVKIPLILLKYIRRNLRPINNHFYIFVSELSFTTIINKDNVVKKFPDFFKF